ncbi:MAG: patatin [Mycobacterium sp.]|nr:patatin [Mycobacterium sp.]
MAQVRTRTGGRTGARAAARPVPRTADQALVLGGGGLAGIAWETGMLLGLAEAGVDVSGAELMVGTSAGSTVGAQLGSGRSLEDLFAAQCGPDTSALQVDVDLGAFLATVGERLAGITDRREGRRRIGALAMAARTPPEAARLVDIEARLPSKNWPGWPLLLPAVDCVTGERRVFTSESGVPLPLAVAASCAVPGIWPATTIEGRRYMDGGIHSSTNALLAAGARRVVILAPLPDVAGPLSEGLDAEIGELRAGGAELVVVTPDEASVEAFGRNPLDPATRRPAALAGRRQAAEEARAVREVWGRTGV